MISNFNWSQFENGYVGGSKLQRNKKIKGQTNSTVCYSHEPYTEELWDIYNNEKIVKKDLSIGDILLVSDISNINNTHITLELFNGISYDIDLNNEKKFIQIFGYENINEFCDVIKNETAKKVFLNNKIYALVINNKPLKISLWQGYVKKIREEFLEQIKTPSNAYTAKIMDANKGGYFVKIQGIDAFMPGSLAAANKLNDFTTLIGKEVIVMIEDFLPEMKCFIVSHKKYIDYVLPSKIKELDLYNKYEGTVTGCSKYGIFVEFGEIFTGLLHVSKMTDETKKNFESRQYKQGDKIEFYIGEITKDNRIILDEESPKVKLEKLEKFVIENKDNIMEVDIVSILNFGMIVNKDEFTGLIPINQFKMYKLQIKNFLVGDTIGVYIDEIKDNKLIFKLPEIKK